ncbi:MAG: hypothetical protein FWD82_00035 [Defluviitaleaceae bacterium]|nr:hypothetical protein [Defluviitaleaceae bacterium]
MSKENNAVWFISYKLVKGANEAEFLKASEVLGREYISKQKGYISWKQLKDGDTWADIATWETMEDAKAFETSGGGGELANKFYSFIDFNSLKSRFYTVEWSY